MDPVAAPWDVGEGFDGAMPELLGDGPAVADELDVGVPALDGLAVWLDGVGDALGLG